MKRSNEKSLSGSLAHNKIVALIPARGGSKSLPHKNIRPFCGKPLIYWTLKAASDSEMVDQVYVATDDTTIATVVENLRLPKVSVIGRSSETATDTASTESVMMEFAANVDCEHILLIQATSPLLEAEDISGGLTKYFKTNADALLSVVRQKRFLWKEDNSSAVPLNYDPQQRPRRQDWDGYFVENGAFYITSKESLLKSHCRISGRTVLYEMPEDTYFEIDEASDWVIAEGLKRQRTKASIGGGTDFSSVNLLISDVDGVLTDAGMYYTESGDELKKFNTRDGKGIELLRNRGIKTMFLTSENISLVKRRAEKLKADYVFMGVKDKKSFLDIFFAENPEFGYPTSVFIGDDVNDRECMQAVQFAATPSDGHSEIKRIADYICNARGGHGCVREVCDLLLEKLG